MLLDTLLCESLLSILCISMYHATPNIPPSVTPYVTSLYYSRAIYYVDLLYLGCLVHDNMLTVSFEG